MISPIRYCSVGTVVDIGSGVTGFQVGDRVVATARMQSLRLYLSTSLPYLLVSALNLLVHNSCINRATGNPTSPTYFGETFVVSGLGLIGLLCTVA